MGDQEPAAASAPSGELSLADKALFILMGEVKLRRERQGKPSTVQQLARIIEKRFDQIVEEGKRAAATYLREHATKGAGKGAEHDKGGE